ncbi:hypothetical protein Pint_29500 [Pistacia integerrima]|uniref:Uncharacterized protein n=1 Tax=Pistacia integerrima TaxID=434235 RepID=A0ACC0WXV2_9ROSI|nr:hypothetical protein Pint_29500 [Pistacia integerrima]
MAETVKQKHFVLVHGTNHGAWCWYKVKPRLETAGHRVTALDLAASGINMKSIHEVHSFYEYTEPLLEILASLPPDEKIILVGHSLGGLNLALAMDKFPEKIYVAVFLSVFMPDTNHHPSYILEQDLELAKTLTRPGSRFSDDLAKSKNFSNEGYGSIARVYIVCEEDMVIPKEFQHWTIENYPVKEVMEIKGADHMAMFSKPQEVTHCLLEIAHKHA